MLLYAGFIFVFDFFANKCLVRCRSVAVFDIVNYKILKLVFRLMEYDGSYIYYREDEVDKIA